MFVQVIQGQIADPAAAKAALERWTQNLAPDAAGWLGTTAGVTENGAFIALARFESEEDARRNSDRPEQGEWWAETSEIFTSEPIFHDSTVVTVDAIGDADQAGFVQIIQGRSSDPERVRELMSSDSGRWAEFRPDIITSLAAEYDGGAYTTALYFTSEKEAREGERKEVPPELKAEMEEMDALSVGEPDFFDLREPWLYSPR